MNLTQRISALSTLAVLLTTGCGSLELPDLGLQATSQTGDRIGVSKPGSSRFTNTHETHYIEEDSLRADRRKKLRSSGLWVTKEEAETLGVDTDTVEEGPADPSSGEVVKKSEDGTEKFFLPPKPLKRHMTVNTPRSGGRFVTGSNRFDPDAE